MRTFSKIKSSHYSNLQSYAYCNLIPTHPLVVMQMIKRILLIVSVLLLLSLFNLFADFQGGLDAYKRNDYETALDKFRSLAEEDDAKAQYYLGVMYATEKVSLKTIWKQ